MAFAAKNSATALRGSAPKYPATFEKVDKTFTLVSFDRSSWSKLGSAKFAAGRRVGVSVCRWQTSCEPTEAVAETAEPHGPALDLNT